jgi:hypothetical protein
MMVIEHSKYTKLNHMPHFHFQKLRRFHFYILEFESTEDTEVPDTSERTMKKNDIKKKKKILASRGFFVLNKIFKLVKPLSVFKTF